LVAALIAVVASLQGSSARADPPVSSSAVDARAQAEAHFYRGLALFKDAAWDGALAEFLESRRLHPTRAATRNAALCLKNLHRFDEALDLFDAVAREFGAAETTVQRGLEDKERTEMEALVGTIAITSSERGASIRVDGRERGVAPLGAVRVAVGSHVVQIYKDGFLPETRTIALVGGATASVDVRLRALGMSGRLRVTEAEGRAASLVVDGLTLGALPWDGALAVGEHRVELVGEGALGAEPVPAPVRLGEITSLSLRMEPLESQLEIEASPPSAEVTLDGVVVGRGVWAGRLRAGEHRVDIARPGYATEHRKVTLARAAPARLRVDLAPERAPPRAAPPRVSFEALAAGLLGRGFGGDVARDGCRAACSASPAVGVVVSARGGVDFASGLGLGLEVGYLGAIQTVRGRAATLYEQPDALRTSAGVVEDRLALRALLIGGSIGFRRGERWSITARLGLGALLGAVVDLRSGTFVDSAVGAFDVAPQREASSARFLYLAPELRGGLRLTPHIEAFAGLRALALLSLTQPVWQNQTDVLTPSSLARYDRASLVGDALSFLSPEVGARLDF
jgi:hypothetical protein